MIKITGRELHDWDQESEAWFAEHLGEIDEDVFAVDGAEMPLEDATNAATDTSVVVVKSGRVFDAVNDETFSLVSMIRKWKKAKDSERLLVEANKDKAGELMAVIQKNGGKIL